MGMEILNLESSGESLDLESALEEMALAQPQFHTYRLSQPEMSIWLMSLKPDTPIFPWWRYESEFDADIHTLRQDWGISSQKDLFDCLSIYQMKKLAGPFCMAIISGSVRVQNFQGIGDEEKKAFNDGQGIIYQLDASFDTRLNINWVPFYQPQSLLWNPSFQTLWSLFKAAQIEEDTNCVTLISLKDPTKIADLTRLLIDKEEHRSEKLAELCDWYGVYSSPINSKFGACAAVYTKSKSTIEKFGSIEKNMKEMVPSAQEELKKDRRPWSALRFLSRHVAL